MSSIAFAFWVYVGLTACVLETQFSPLRTVFTMADSLKTPKEEDVREVVYRDYPVEDPHSVFFSVSSARHFWFGVSDIFLIAAT